MVYDETKLSPVGLTGPRYSCRLHLMHALKKPHLTIVASHPIQHFCPLYAALAADGRLDITVVFLTLRGAQAFYDKDFGKMIEWKTRPTEGFRWEVINDPFDLRLGLRYGAIDKLVTSIRRLRPDAIAVYGYSRWEAVVSAGAGRTYGAKVLAITDSELLHQRSLLANCAKHVLLPLWRPLVTALLTCGDENERYWTAWGFPPERMIRCPFSIDEPVLRAALKGAATSGRLLRRSLGFPPTALLGLSVGKLIERKGHADLIRSVAATRATTEVRLCIAGDGPEKPNLETLARSLGVSDRVRFSGFVPPAQLAEYYAVADLYIHPAYMDPHPLAISEAIFCGLPVITTDMVGSVGPTDDVQPGRNGFVVKAGDWRSVAELLDRLCGSRDELASASAWSRSISQSRGMSQSVEAVVRAVDSALWS